MRAIVAGTIRFLASECPPKALEKLRRNMSFPNPDYAKRQRLGRYLGNTAERIECLMERADGWVEIPRGTVSLLRKRLAESGVAVNFDDHRTLLKAVNFELRTKLRPYQQEAVERMRNGVQGYVVAPCGGGKGIIGSAALAAVRQPTLIIVHTRDLLDQWCEVLRKSLLIEPGVVANGKSRPDIVTVATVQTLAQLGNLNHLAQRFGCVIIDELHHSPSSIFQKVINRLPAHCRFGLTATPYREDGLTPLIDFTFGRRLFEIGHEELMANGFLQKPEVKAVYSAFTFDYNGPKDYHRCLAALITDTDRNRQIVQLAVDDASDDHTVLVLSNRVEHCRHLAELIRKEGVNAEVMVGAVGKSRRRAILEKFKEGRLPVVVASSLADEGLDVPRLDRIILAFPSRAKARTVQRLGRLMRPHPNKQRAVLFDIVDAAVMPLVRQYRERRKLYAELLG